jgi:hypothetical protein
MKNMENREGHKKRICELLTCIMKLMGYPGELSPANFSARLKSTTVGFAKMMQRFISSISTGMEMK